MADTSEPTDEQLAAWLRLGEAAPPGSWHDSDFIAASREGWPATIQALQAARARIAELEERLEITWCWAEIDDQLKCVEAVPRLSFDCDGIACRDETIRLQDAQLAKLEERIAELDAGTADLLAERDRWQTEAADLQVRLRGVQGQLQSALRR